MNRYIIPLLDNDVLTLIGKEVIKIRDRKTLEYWMEFYTHRPKKIDLTTLRTVQWRTNLSQGIGYYHLRYDGLQDRHPHKRITDNLYPQISREVMMITISNFNSYRVYPKKRWEKIPRIKRLEDKVNRYPIWTKEWFEKHQKLCEYDSDYDSEEDGISTDDDDYW